MNETLSGKEEVAPDWEIGTGQGTEKSARPRVLICDDDDIALDLMALHMEQAGFDVVRAENGQIGIARLYEISPDIVLLDMMMPVASGDAVLRHMQSVPELARIPVVVVTSRAFVREAVSAFQNGAVDFVTKPFHPEDLVHCARQALAKSSVARKSTASL